MEQIELFNGGVIVREDKLYTKVHSYKHPQKDLEILLVGDYHIGTNGYSKRLKTHLDTCDVIFYEDFFDEDESLEELSDKGIEELLSHKDIKQLAKESTTHLGGIDWKSFENSEDFQLKGIEELAKEDLSSALLSSLNLFYNTYENIKGIESIEIEDLIDSKLKTKWVPTDYVRTREIAAGILDDLKRRIDNIGDNKRLSLLNSITSGIKGFNENKITQKDLMDIYIKFYQDKDILNAFMSSNLNKYRNSFVFCATELKLVFKEFTPINRLGIFYGAGHISGLRELLENADYKHIKEEEVLAMEFN